jgi:hypothetical protein
MPDKPDMTSGITRYRAVKEWGLARLAPFALQRYSFPGGRENIERRRHPLNPPAIPDLYGGTPFRIAFSSLPRRTDPHQMSP